MQRVDVKRQFIREAVEKLPSDGRNGLLVSDAMTANPVCVPAERTALQIVDIFQEMRFQHMLVTDQGRLVGVLSDRDVVRLFGTHESEERNYLETITAGELMSLDPVTTTPDTPLLDAVSLMLENGLHCLPVVDHGLACGILTSTDLFLALEQILQGAPARCTVA
jgi:acetoin utilization protein AcuB